MIDQARDPSHLSKESTRIDSSQHLNKNIIIIILKLDSKVDPKQVLSHRLRGSIQIDSS
jgi:hypothetical protein